MFLLEFTQLWFNMKKKYLAIIINQLDMALIP
jgi:hypothetical protein